MSTINWGTLFSEIESVLGPLENLLAKHTTGTTATVITDVEKLTPAAVQVATAIAASPNVAGVVSQIPTVIEAAASLTAKPATP